MFEMFRSKLKCWLIIGLILSITFYCYSNFINQYQSTLTLKFNDSVTLDYDSNPVHMLNELIASKNGDVWISSDVTTKEYGEHALSQLAINQTKDNQILISITDDDPQKVFDVIKKIESWIFDDREQLAKKKELAQTMDLLFNEEKEINYQIENLMQQSDTYNKELTANKLQVSNQNLSTLGKAIDSIAIDLELYKNRQSSLQYQLDNERDIQITVFEINTLLSQRDQIIAEKEKIRLEADLSNRDSKKDIISNDHYELDIATQNDLLSLNNQLDKIDLEINALEKKVGFVNSVSTPALLNQLRHDMVLAGIEYESLDKKRLELLKTLEKERLNNKNLNRFTK